MRLCMIQMSPGADKRENIQQARHLIESAIEKAKPNLIVLPEMWSCLGGDRSSKLAAAEDLPDADGMGGAGDAYAFLKELAQKAGIFVHGGSIGERVGQQIANTTVMFGPDGVELGRYRKIHLFDVVTSTGATYRESDTFVAGKSVVTVKLGGLIAGLAICYDIRFAELFLELRRSGAELLILPAAFTMETGEAHWEVLLRARAIETQCWLAAAATCGQHYDARGTARSTYGHSALVDPWGTIAVLADEQPGWINGQIEMDSIRRIRSGFPVMEHRRLP